MNTQSLATLAEKKLEMVTGGLRDFRLTNLELFKKEGLKHHPVFYKFTNLTTFMDALEYSPYEATNADLSQYQHPDFINLIFVDGELSKTPSVSGLKVSTL